MASAKSVDPVDFVEDLKGSFILKFQSAYDIPTTDYGSKCDPFLKAYISMNVPHFDQDNKKFYKMQRISPVIQTPKRTDCTSVIWNCYRDFSVQPPADAVLTIEIYHASGDVKPDILLGKAEAPVGAFADEGPKIFNFVNYRSNSKGKNPNFSVTLCRVFLNREPPLQKTFFLIRHGQSKWNEAQSKINITGMLLDRDHALTELGLKQAEDLNKRWKSGEIMPAVCSSQSSAPATAMSKDADDEECRNNTENRHGSMSEAGSNRESVTFATGNLLYGYDDGPSSLQSAAGGEKTGNTPDKWKLFTDDLLEPEHLQREQGMHEVIEPPLSPSRPTIRASNASETAAKAATTPPPPIRINTAEELLTHSLSLSYSPGTSPSHTQDCAQDSALPFPMDPSKDSDPESAVKPHSTSSVNLNGVAATEGVTITTAESEPDEVVKLESSTTDPFGSYEDGLTLNTTRDTIAILEEFHSTDLDNVQSPEEEFILQRRTEYVALFMHADKVYSSPLTRAIETAYVSMNGHPALITDGLTLYSVIREVKKLGGMDTVGVECGAENILRRVKSEMAEIKGKSYANDLMDHIEFFVGDADQPWWNAASSFEHTRDKQDRVREFLTFARYCDAKLPVFVGHSLFFKAFYSTRISSMLLNNRPDLSENLGKFRLSNASLLAVTVNFVDVENGLSDAVITDADLIFGGGFHGAPPPEEDDNDNRDDSDTAASSANTVYATSPQQHIFNIATNIQQNLKANFKEDIVKGKDALKKGAKLLSEKFNTFFEKG